MAVLESQTTTNVLLIGIFVVVCMGYNEIKKQSEPSFVEKTLNFAKNYCASSFISSLLSLIPQLAA